MSEHVLVTGGGTGVGRSIALALAGAGHAVTICGRRREPLEAAAAAHGAITARSADVTDADAMRALHEEATSAGRPFTAVIANAGNAQTAPAASLAPEQFEAMLRLNLTGPFLTVSPALPEMTARRSGRIVFIASTAGLKGYPYTAAYCAAKHGVIGLMRSLAAELAETGITVNAICPGFTETEMLEHSIETVARRTGRAPSEIERVFKAANPQRRFVQPDEIADAVLWLMSEGARSVTGQAISISGGATW